MPIKWTPENDQLLLLKILETHALSVDTTKVSNTWPKKAGQDKPSPRAISERIVKIRNTAKANGENGSPEKPTSKTSTPSKRGSGNAATPGSKRSRKNGSDSIKTEKADISKLVKDEQENMGIVAKVEPEDVFGGRGRVRTAPALPLGMVCYAEDTDEDERKYETTDSEYAPSGFGIDKEIEAIADYA